MAQFRVVAKHRLPQSDYFTVDMVEASDVTVSADGDLLFINYNQKSLVPEFFPVVGFASGCWKTFARVND